MIYQIKLTKLSPNFKQVTNTKIIISGFEMVKDKPGRFEKVNEMEFLDGEWKENKCRQYAISTGVNHKIHSEILDKDVFTHNKIGVLFETFELAYISKVLSSRLVTDKINNHINELESFRNQEAPDVSDHLEKIKEDYPEMFI